MTTAMASDPTLVATVNAIGDAMVKTIREGGRILWFGNGGSAADAQHLSTELVVRYRKNRPAIASIALTTDTSALTATGNDLGFEQVFARQIEALGRPGDLAVGITTSGTSDNVLLGLEQAKSSGLTAVGFVGAETNDRLAASTDLLLQIPSPVTAHVQEAHILCGHVLCEIVEASIV